MKEKGFTLVELLVVIVVIGILAVALLAAIDPLEQIRRGRDTETMSAAKEFLSACERYYGNHEAYPWGTTTPSAVNITSTSWAGATVEGDLLVTDGELRAGFEARSPIVQEKLWLTETTGEVVHVCFDPESKTVGGKADCSSSASCPAAGGTYFCLPDSAQ